MWHAQNQNFFKKSNKKGSDFYENLAAAQKNATATAATKTSSKFFSYKIVFHLRSIRTRKVLLFLLDFSTVQKININDLDIFLLLNLY